MFVKSEYDLSLTIVIPRVVIPKSDTNDTKQNISGIFLNLTLHTKETRRPYPLCINESFWRMKNCFSTQGCIFEPTIAIACKEQRRHLTSYADVAPHTKPDLSQKDLKCPCNVFQITQN